MKALRNKSTGKIIISHWKSPKTDEKAASQFGKTLRNSGDRNTTLKQVSDRKYVDTRPSINK